MNQSAIGTLHILTPVSGRTPGSLAEEGTVATGDLIADLRRFPGVAYTVKADGTCQDVTTDLLASPDYWTITREWLADLTERTGLQDALSIAGYGFWWTLNGQRFVVSLTELGDSFGWIDLLDAIQKHGPPPLITLYGQHKVIRYLAEQILDGTEVRIQGETEEHHRESSGVPRNLLLLLVRALLSVVYFFYALLRRPDICILSNTNLLRQTGSGSKQRLHDVYLGDVIQTLQNRGWRVTVIEKYGWYASWKGLAARGLFFPSDLLFLLSSPALGRLGIHRQVIRKWRARWLKMRPALVGDLRYRGYDISSLVLPLIEKEFVRHAPNLEVMVGLWRRILGLWRPKVLYLQNSYGRSALPAIIAAKLLGILTIEQQHGVIGRNHIAYLVPHHLKLNSQFPLCDRMFVWGEYFKRLLVDRGVYQPQDISVCGFPRIDSLFRQLPTRTKTCAQLGIPPDAPIVLYTSNAFGQDYLYDILDSIQHGPDSAAIHWLIKLHPREKTRHLWEKEISKRGLQTVQVLEGTPGFYALLAACDIHVSFASTTLIEAAVLGKPNLGLDIARVSDPPGYAQAKAFLPVAPADLGPVVHRLLLNPEQQAQLQAEQRAFADDWCFHDGKAVSRIADLIESLIAQSNNSKRGANATI